MEGRSISQGATFHCLLGEGVTKRRPAVLIALHSERVMEQMSTGRSSPASSWNCLAPLVRAIASHCGERLKM